MNLGKVTGTVWATKKDPKLVGLKLLIIQNLTLDGKLKDSYIVAVDSVGAGIGEVVLTCGGSSARQTEITQNKPIDAVVMAIVDKLDVQLD